MNVAFLRMIADRVQQEHGEVDIYILAQDGKTLYPLTHTTYLAMTDTIMILKPNYEVSKTLELT